MNPQHHDQPQGEDVFLGPDGKPSLRPVRVNNVAIFSIGTGIWGIALVVLIVLNTFTSTSCAEWIWISVTGVALGFLAIFYVSRSWRAQ